MSTPNDIIRLAENNTFIANFLGEWRSGKLSWEQALIEMVVHLGQIGEVGMKEELFFPIVPPSNGEVCEAFRDTTNAT